jgi:hypothetical protein
MSLLAGGKAWGCIPDCDFSLQCKGQTYAKMLGLPTLEPDKDYPLVNPPEVEVVFDEDPRRGFNRVLDIRILPDEEIALGSHN